MELFEEILICAVAQRPFEVPSGGRLPNIFCTVVPLWHEDGEPVNARDFPNNGLIWWKLRPGDMPLAKPGRLISAPVEYAHRYSPDDPDKQLYQLVPQDVRPLSETEAVELLRADARTIRSPRDLVNTVGAVETDHVPGEIVLVALGDAVLGPLVTTVVASDKGLHRISVRAAAADGTVRQVSLSATERALSRLSDVQISMDASPPHRSANLRRLQFEIVRGDVIDDLLLEAPVLEVPRDEDLIAGTARRLLTRRERQEFMALLERLDELTVDGDAPDEREVIAALRRRTIRPGPEDLELARAILDTGILDDRIREVLDQRARAYIEERAAELQAEIEARTAETANRLRQLERERSNFERQLDERARTVETELNARIEDAWREHRRRVEEDRAALEADRARLESQRRSLSETLESAAERYTTGQQSVIADALALMPVLDALGRGRTTSADSQAAHDTDAPARQRFEMPAFVTTPRQRGELQETAFMLRFERIVAASGLRYRATDLHLFHNAWKCAELILVSGPPGSGKSSLPRLYAQALAGSTETGDPAGMTRFLRVPVRATWLDVADVIGYVNPAHRAFEPGAPGVLRQLIAAAEEYQRHDGLAGLHTICFDDADLAPIESWMGDLLQVAGGSGERILRVFDPAAVSTADPFAPWATLHLPRSLRFVLTLAGSETAGMVGRRVHDRAAAIRLRPVAEPLAPPAGPTTGPPVGLDDLDRWTCEAPLPPPLRRALDTLTPALERLDIPIGPRSERILSRLVASAAPLLDPVAAFDAQLASGLLEPARPGPDEAEDLLDLLDALDIRLPECQEVLLRRRDANARLEP